MIITIIIILYSNSNDHSNSNNTNGNNRVSACFLRAKAMCFLSTLYINISSFFGAKAAKDFSGLKQHFKHKCPAL